MKNNYYYKGANPTVDLIIINPNNEVLLVKRTENSPACPGMWAIPGGFVDTNAKQNESWAEGRETPEQAAIREVKEETNLELNNPKLSFVGCFEGGGRDPRDNEESWSKSYAFLHFIDREVFESQKDQIRGQESEVDKATWISVKEAQSLNLAFDHNKILETALVMDNESKLKKKVRP